VLDRQQDSGIGDIESLQKKIPAWSTDMNNSHRGVDWQMKITDASFN